MSCCHWIFMVALSQLWFFALPSLETASILCEAPFELLNRQSASLFRDSLLYWSSTSSPVVSFISIQLCLEYSFWLWFPLLAGLSLTVSNFVIPSPSLWGVVCANMLTFWIPPALRLRPKVASHWRSVIVITLPESLLLVPESSRGYMERVRECLSHVVLASRAICRTLMAWKNWVRMCHVVFDSIVFQAWQSRSMPFLSHASPSLVSFFFCLAYLSPDCPFKCVCIPTGIC